MAFGTKTNERPGTRAQVRYLRVSAYKAREVLDLIRDLHVDDADGVLEFTDRAVATEIRKVLAAAVANAEHNDSIDPNELYVSACYADEGPTLKRWRPRARGRATRIRKRTCHITIIVSRMDPKKLEQRRARVAKSQAARAAREAEHDHDHDHEGHDHGDEADDAAEVPGEPTEETIEQAEEAAADLTDEVLAEADNENPAEPDEAVEAAVEEAAEHADDAEASDESSDEEQK